MRTAFLLLATTILSSAQSLFDLAPDHDSQDHLPLRWTASINFGYDDSPNDPPNPPSLYFFGDSLTDTGNLANLIGSLGPGYPGTSFTNGITWAKYLQPNLTLVSHLDPTATRNPGSLDLAVASSTTDGILNGQLPIFTTLAPTFQISPHDLAFVWGGGNDFRNLFQGPPPSAQDISNTTSNTLDNLIDTVSGIRATGVEKVAVFNLINFGLAPDADGREQISGQLADQFNRQFESRLRALPNHQNLLYLDINHLLNRAVTNPDAFGLTNTNDAANPAAPGPNGFDGTASTLTPSEEAEFLFYDPIHPTTGVHRQIAVFVAHHLTLDQAASDAHLVTDAALFLDDRSSFENDDLKAGQFNFQIAAQTYQNKSAPARRSTQAIKADLDFSLTDRFQIGAEFFYAEGDSARSDFDSLGFGLDATLQGTQGQLAWEIGAGLGLISGDLARNYQVGNFTAKSHQSATVLTTHASLHDDSFSLGKLDAYWQIGLKQRFVFRDNARESGAASLNLRYHSETLATTLANLELGLRFTEKTTLQLALNPVLLHSGGEISASQRGGFGAFKTSDHSGYKIHTARATLHHQLHENTTLSTTLTAGSNNTWFANATVGLRF